MDKTSLNVSTLIIIFIGFILFFIFVGILFKSLIEKFLNPSSISRKITEVEILRQEKEKTVGFTFGEYLIYSGFIFGGLMIFSGLLFSVIRLLPQPSLNKIEIFFSPAFSLEYYLKQKYFKNFINGFIFLIMAYGLHKRKKWGFYIFSLSNVISFVSITIIAMLGITKGLDLEIILLAILGLIIPSCLLIYFWKRRSLFH